MQIGKAGRLFLAPASAILQFLFCNFYLAMAAPVAAANDDEPPIVGQPPHFNGAVGRFGVKPSADPRKLQAEDPLTYTIRITAEGKVAQPPQRPPLAEFPRFAEEFYVADAGPPEGTQPEPGKIWEFAYRLKPKNTAVTEIPSFPFVFYRPGFLQPRQGYMTVYVPAIPITVTPRKSVNIIPPARPIAGPEAAFALADGDALRRDGDGRLPNVFVLLLALLAAPAGCLAWYVAWRRLYPDSARSAQKRRSRAAREALRSLHDMEKEADPQRLASRAAVAVTTYLRMRLELAVREPTPSEAEAHLRRHGVSEKTAGQTADLLQACAAVRFDPEPPTATGLTDAAARLILALEAETWSE
jgi:hypothetical protein